ncbi:hypothetical protein VOLCADRAFT_91445 [Volvox carteri f. nagariensis]|uniref:Uncharacterized protein n=1 Tax=Volvox carteri f. nagariensis TaxID=3068 RepID=D8TX38_VOLCA|nr:uncharacterized protein VOLCADRAFT_91445 [Volvox carteri f. nagariensis]EFJ47943.1 hypothetical protein VOLCADRAFT_91445 [Volvox carteri f. nagariensis]|eukprot:XP_002951049.1 hypothetical protein VOLCADRAFT_91445 [Volvox carteri f. nagariensis]
MSKRPSESGHGSPKSKKIQRVAFSDIKDWDKFKKIMDVSNNFPETYLDMFGENSVFTRRDSQELDVAVQTFIVEFLSKPVALFKEIVLRPDDREKPRYLLL